MSVCVWLVSLSITSSGSIHAAGVRIPSFRGLSNTPLYGETTLFVRSSVDGHFGCSLLLAIMSNALMNMGVQVSVQDRSGDGSPAGQRAGGPCVRGAGTAVGALLSPYVTCLWLDYLSHSVKFLSFHIHPEGQDQLVSIIGVSPIIPRKEGEVGETREQSQNSSEAAESRTDYPCSGLFQGCVPPTPGGERQMATTGRSVPSKEQCRPNTVHLGKSSVPRLHGSPSSAQK